MTSASIGATLLVDLKGPLETCGTQTLDDSKINNSLIGNIAQGRRKILLQGPSQSGRSSLLVEFACAVASSTPCRCIRPSEGECCCIAVTIFIVATSPEKSFPLQCFSTRKDTDASTYSPETLRRIEIHHVTSYRDVMSYLLTIQGRPESQQPRGAIMVDDLDLIVARQEEGPDRKSLASTIIALLLDTARYLKRIHHTEPISLVSLHDDHIRSVLTSFWNPLHFVISSLENPTKCLTGANGSDHIVSCWNVREPFHHNSNDSPPWTAEYAIVQDVHQTFRIVWIAEKNE